MDRLFEFTGRFHPLFVHLPIGFLLIAAVFIWLKESERVIRISLGLGAIAAVASALTGVMLAGTGDYTESVSTHKWFGISLGVVSIILCFVPIDKLKIGSAVVVILVLITGHLGGSITHGAGYLFVSTSDREVDTPDLNTLDLNKAIFYKDAVEPVLAARCYSCHGEAKQKGGLRLDKPDLVIKGGKNGKVIEPGNPEESDLVKRIDLPSDDEDHMPPKERRQLTDQEKKLISLWIASGSDFSKKITELVDEKKLNELMSSESDAIQLPDVDVPEPNGELIAKLTEQNVAITPVAEGSNFLQVNFVSVPEGVTALLPMLKPIADNVVLLKITNAETVNGIQDFKNLTSLNLSGSNVGDALIEEIIKCRMIAALNLAGTKVTGEGIKKLKACEKLRYLNLYNTSVKTADLPGVTVEFGGYNVPTLESDTTEVKSN